MAPTTLSGEWPRIVCVTDWCRLFHELSFACSLPHLAQACSRACLPAKQPPCGSASSVRAGSCSRLPSGGARGRARRRAQRLQVGREGRGHMCWRVGACPAAGHAALAHTGAACSRQARMRVRTPGSLQPASTLAVSLICSKERRAPAWRGATLCCCLTLKQVLPCATSKTAVIVPPNCRGGGRQPGAAPRCGAGPEGLCAVHSLRCAS